MSKLCKKICAVGILLLVCGTIIGIPKNGEGPDPIWIWNNSSVTL